MLLTIALVLGGAVGMYSNWVQTQLCSKNAPPAVWILPTSCQRPYRLPCKHMARRKEGEIIEDDKKNGWALGKERERERESKKERERE